MEDQVTPENLFCGSDANENPEPVTQNADQLQSVRAELITLAEKHEIKHSVAYIKKASQGALEKIKGDYERKQLEETNDYLSETLMGKLSEFMEATNMIDDAKSMEEELVHNKMVKRDLKNILEHITPYIPLIGLVCGVTIVGKHVYNKKPTEPKPQE